MRSSRIINVAAMVAALVLLLTSFLHCAILGDAKKLGDGVSVNLTGLVATSVSTDTANRVYLQDPDRDCGIWVQTGQAAVRGNTYNVSGTIRTDSATGERYITASLTSATPAAAPEPRGMTLRALGGGNFGTPPSGQQGISGAAGLNNIGLLVRTWGIVTQVGTGYLYLDDGSGVKDGTLTGAAENVGVRVVCNPAGYSTGDKLEVTGISSCFKVTSGLARRILIRDASDLRKLLPPDYEPFTPNYVADLDGNLLHWDHLPITASFNLPADWTTIYGSQSNVYIQAANEWNPSGQQAMIQVLPWGSATDVTVEFVNQSVLGGNVWGLCSYSYYPSIMEMATATIQVALRDSLGRTTSAVDMKSVIAHELGHALGIGGHSTNSDDLMYPSITSGVPSPATVRDLNTAKSAYPSYFGVTMMTQQAIADRGKIVTAVIE